MMEFLACKQLKGPDENSMGGSLEKLVTYADLLMKVSHHDKDETKKKLFREKETFIKKVAPEPEPEKIFTANNVLLLKQDKETKKEFNSAHYIYQKSAKMEDLKTNELLEKISAQLAGRGVGEGWNVNQSNKDFFMQIFKKAPNQVLNKGTGKNFSNLNEFYDDKNITMAVADLLIDPNDPNPSGQESEDFREGETRLEIDIKKSMNPLGGLITNPDKFSKFTEMYFDSKLYRTCEDPFEKADENTSYSTPPSSQNKSRKNSSDNNKNSLVFPSQLCINNFTGSKKENTVSTTHGYSNSNPWRTTYSTGWQSNPKLNFKELHESESSRRHR